MKKSAASTLIASMLLIAFASAALAADNNIVFAKDDAVEIYGPMYNGSNLIEIIARQGSNSAITMDGNNFAAFNLDLKNNVTTESLSVEGIPGTSGRAIGEHRLVYTTKVLQTPYMHISYDPADTDWGSYPAIDFFGERYVLLKSKDSIKFAKLIIDNDLKYALTPGEKLDLGQGYSLQYKHADDKGKVLLEFDKDGRFVANAVVELYGDASRTWTCKVNNIQGEYDVPVLKVHVNPVFDSNPTWKVILVQGIWLIDYANSFSIKNGDKLGQLDDLSVNGSILTFSNKDALTLTRDSDLEIGQGIYFQIADSDELRFYPYFKKTIDNTMGTFTSRNNSTTPAVGNDENYTAAGGETPAENNTTTEKKPVPGFGIFFAIFGLFAVVYLQYFRNY